MDANGELTLEKFHTAFIESATAWGYDISNITSPSDELKIFEDMKSKKGTQLYKNCDRMYELAHVKRKGIQMKWFRNRWSWIKKRGDEARKHREAIDKLVEYETDSDDEHDLETNNTRTGRGSKIIPNNTASSPAMSKAANQGVEESTQQSILDENTAYNEKQMLIRIFRKYRQGLNRLFLFYSKEYVRW